MARYPRDWQRSKVYRAEGMHSRAAAAHKGIGRLRTLPQTEQYLLNVTGSVWYRRLWPRWAATVDGLAFELHDGRRHTAACVKWGYLMVLPVWARHPWHLLHELAHIVTPGAGLVPAHGWEYCNAFLLLVRHTMGYEAAAEMLQLYNEHGVRLHPTAVEADKHAKAGERRRKIVAGQAAKPVQPRLYYEITDLLADRTDMVAHG